MLTTTQKLKEILQKSKENLQIFNALDIPILIFVQMSCAREQTRVVYITTLLHSSLSCFLLPVSCNVIVGASEVLVRWLFTVDTGFVK